MAVINAVCVYCGSSPGRDSHHGDAARLFGRALAEAGIDLIYGGGRIGLMGELASAALEAGGRVVGIIPESLKRSEVAHDRLDRLDVVDSMHERKRRMFECADAFVVLPGGPGTLDETLEILTWRQLRLHDKPILLVNHRGYWQPLLDLIAHTIEQGFARPSLLDLFIVVPEIDDVLETLQRLPEPRPIDHSDRF